MRCTNTKCNTHEFHWMLYVDFQMLNTILTPYKLDTNARRHWFFSHDFKQKYFNDLATLLFQQARSKQKPFSFCISWCPLRDVKIIFRSHVYPRIFFATFPLPHHILYDKTFQNCFYCAAAFSPVTQSQRRKHYVTKPD